MQVGHAVGVQDAARRRLRRERGHAVEEPHAAAEHDGYEMQAEFLHHPGRQALPDEVGAASDHDVPVARRCARLLQRVRESGRYEIGLIREFRGWMCSDVPR